MAEGIAVSPYGTDLSGTLANLPSNVPAGLSYYATDVKQLFFSNGDGTWSAQGAQSSVVTITSAQLLALNATPQTIVSAPGAGKALIFDGALLHKPAGTAYAGIAAGEDLSVKYTDESGAEVGVCETTGFLDQTTAQTRWIRPHAPDGAGVASQITPVANAVLALHLLVGEIITGDSDLLVQTHYRVVDTVLS